MKKFILPLLAVLVLGACASQPDSVVAINVSPDLYTNQTCKVIVSKLERARVDEAKLVTSQQEAANGDIAAVIIGGVLLGPLGAVLATAVVDGDVESQLAYAKGKTIALVEAHDITCVK